MKILLLGATGRLGSEIEKILKDKKVTVSTITRDMTQNPEKLAKEFGEKAIIVDVSLPEGTLNTLDSLKKMPAANQANLHMYICGVTGLNAEERQELTQASESFPICLVSNFSKGILLLEEIANAKTSSGVSVAEFAKQLGFESAIWESHHAKKLDAPSGTAITLAEAYQVKEEDVAATRVGYIKGEHTVLYSGPSECIRITHTAHTRALFAEGAVLMCENAWKKDFSKKLYNKNELF